jgi:hypothetical protein
LSKVPDIFIVGAPRCGTTYLSSVLGMHPGVFMCPVKEPHHFAFPDISLNEFRPELRRRIENFNLTEYLNKPERKPVHRMYIVNRGDYLKLFSEAPRDVLLAEASPSYLWAAGAAGRIYNENPDARIIIMLRNPVERAVSQYFIERKMGMTRRSAEADIRFDLNFSKRKWGASPLYVELGLYSKPVKQYLHIFGKEKVFIGLLEDLEKNQEEFINKLFLFLNLSPVAFSGDAGNRNTAEIPRMDWLNEFRHVPAVKSLNRIILKGPFKKKLKQWFFKKSEIPDMSEIKRILLPIFEPDITELEKITGFDLTAWKI